MGVDEPRLPLAATIQALRTELLHALEQSQGEDLRFALGPVELDLQLTISQEGSKEAGIKFWVVSAGATGSSSETTTHTVRLTLTPVGETGDVLVGSRTNRPH